MQLFDVGNPMVLVFGILGNIISAGVYFAPLPTFREIYKRKSTMGFQSLPYIVSLFSALLWLFYALIKGENAFLLISINSLGTVIESIYIIVFLVYATPDTKKQTFKSLAGLMMLCLVILLGAYFPFHKQTRVAVVGWVCVGVSVCVFAAPLSIVFQVVRTKSVEYMPLPLSCFLTLSASTWFAYGWSIKDTCVTVPNILGFALGLIQMALYAYYYKRPSSGRQEKKAGKVKEHIINITMLSNSEVHPVDSGRTSEAEAEAEAEEEEKKGDDDQVIKVDIPHVKQTDQVVKVDVPTTEVAHVKQLDTRGVLVMCAAA